MTRSRPHPAVRDGSPSDAEAPTPGRPFGGAGLRGLAVVTEACRLWSEEGATRHAGALAFYTLFSLAPLLIILVAIVAAVFGEEAARGEISARIAHVIGPQAAEAVQAAIRRSRIEESGLLATTLAVGALLAGATTAFAQLQASLNQLWGVVARPSRSGLTVFVATRLESLGLVLVIGLILLTSLAVSTVTSATLQFAEGWIPVPTPIVAGLDLVASLFTATLLFAMIFKILPDVQLRWRDMWVGASVTALLFVVGQAAISFYLTRTAPASTYGAAGALVVVLLWVYYSSLIMFFGASLTRAVIRQRGDRLIPKSTAVRVRREVIEDIDGPP